MRIGAWEQEGRKLGKARKREKVHTPSSRFFCG